MADGIDDPNKTPPTGTQAASATPPTTPQADTVTMSRADLDALIEQRANAAAAAARRAEQGKQKPNAESPQNTKPDPVTPVGAEQVAMLVAQAVARETAFHEATRDAGLSPAQAATLRKLMVVDNPQDAVAVTAWVKEQATVFGKTANQQATTPQTATQPTAPSVPAPIAASPPSMTIPLERDVSVLEMSAEQIHDLMRKKGGDPSNPYHPRNRAARREIRKETEAALRTRRVRLGS
jgi:hypothetical protein